MDDVMTDSSSGSNDVWGTIGRIGTDIAGVWRDTQVAKQTTAQVQAQQQAAATIATASRAQAAPSGFVNSSPFNPLPGLFSSFPQADGKVANYAGSTANGGMPSAMLWIIVAVVGFVMFALVRR